VWCADAWCGHARRAWVELTATNPLPAVTARLCPGPCASAPDADLVERRLGDLAIDEGWELDVPEAWSGTSVLVVGSGPAGLSAAYQLRRQGHGVTVRERRDEPGGRLRDVPSDVLPPEVLLAEVSRITAAGVRLELGREVGQGPQRGFDAVVRPADDGPVPTAVGRGAAAALALAGGL
jgi:NADPH-dependent glutamate synthase beta subunit-like oxidoreductase